MIQQTYVHLSSPVILARLGRWKSGRLPYRRMPCLSRVLATKKVLHTTCCHSTCTSGVHHTCAGAGVSGRRHGLIHALCNCVGRNTCMHPTVYVRCETHVLHRSPCLGVATRCAACMHRAWRAESCACGAVVQCSRSQGVPFFVCCVVPATLHAWMGSLWVTASGLSVTDAGIKDAGAGCRCSGGTAVSWSVVLLQLVASVFWGGRGLTALLCFAAW